MADWLKALEPLAQQSSARGDTLALISIAISLKRLADLQCDPAVVPPKEPE